MTVSTGIIAGIWSIWTGAMGTLPYWNPYGATAIPVAMAIMLAILAWLVWRGETRD